MGGYKTVEAAKRSSKNRPAGALVTKPITAVTKGVHHRMMLDNVLPAIIGESPKAKSLPIQIQEGNAKPHGVATRKAVAAAAKAQGCDITVKPQPPSSPDYNILDLGSSHAIQALKGQESPNTIDELIQCVESASWNQDKVTLDNVWISLQSALLESMKVNGGNEYKLGHIGKEETRGLGVAPGVKVETSVIEEAKRTIASANEPKVKIEDEPEDPPPALCVTEDPPTARRLGDALEQEHLRSALLQSVPLGVKAEEI